VAFSAEEGKGFFKDWLIHFAQPEGYSTFLDVGCGAGAYGKLIREVFGKEVGVDAVEIFPAYINRHGLNSIYNRIITADIMQCWPMLYPYDLIICGDVLEHLCKEDAIKLIDCLRPKCRFIWCALPMKVEGRSWSLGYPQGPEDYEENPHGKHLAEWTMADIELSFSPMWIVPYRITGTFLVEGELK
jgi:SAM-dependent methyltransferase